MNDTTKTLLRIEGLRIENRRTGEAFVRSVNLELRAGEKLAVIGESGAGKSITMRAAAGLLPKCLRATGSIELFGRDILRDPRGAQGLLGTGLCYLTQQGASAFDPLLAVGRQLLDAARKAAPEKTKAEHAAEIRRVLGALRFAPESIETVLAARPAELSGGMLQRAMVAAAMLLKPQIVVADEPTSALDASSTREVVRLLQALVDATGAALVVVTHDLAVAQALARRVVVMRRGEIVETGTRSVLDSPGHPFTQRLVAARRSMTRALLRVLTPESASDAAQANAANTTAGEDVLLSVRGLSKAYPCSNASARRSTSCPNESSEPALEARTQTAGFLASLRSRLFGSVRTERASLPVLRCIDLDIRRGEAVALVGASGAGKTTLARLILGLEAADAGEIRYARDMRLPGRLSAVFQNTTDALDPRWRAETCVLEALRLSGAALEEPHAKASSLLAAMGLKPEALGRRPHELSGGELQRVAFARAIAAEPAFIVFDEAMSSLDASVRANLIELLIEMRRRPGAPAMLFITHDLAAAAALADRVLFLDGGRIVEALPVGALSRAASPAAKALLAAAQEAAGF